MVDSKPGLMGQLLRLPDPDAGVTSRVAVYMEWMARHRGRRFSSYEDLWRWSVDNLAEFWLSLWEYFEVEVTAGPPARFEVGSMPGTTWFPGVGLNYARYLLDGRFAAESSAVVGISQSREQVRLSYGELATAVARARVGLERLGIGRGDVVVGYLPNIPEALVAFLATASLGAVWSSCASEFGERAVIERFGQIDPKVLVTVGGYMYGEKAVERRAQVASISKALSTLEAVVDIGYGQFSLDEADRDLSWAELLDGSGALEFESVAFDHPLFVLYSSGTTGLPKAIVHGHGGILLEHLKNHALSWDLGPGDRLMWFTTTAWMMWNALVSTLLTGASIVMLDGNPMYPDLHGQWRTAAETGASVLGLNPGYIMACRRAAIEPRVDHDLSVLREVCSAGAPLPPEGAAWITEVLGPEVFLNNGSGGTDVCSGIVQGNPLLPVWAGEISGRCLGVAAYAFDERGHEVVDELGELVITKPMPSMPVRLVGDADGTKLASTYFDFYSGVWRQGDWIRFTERGSCEITGRSDATLNRGGVRLGTGEFYRALDRLPEVTDALVVHLEDPDGGVGRLILFVVLAEGRVLDDDLENEIARSVVAELSPRHRPDEVVQMPGVPRSLTGKLLELPVKRMLQGVPATDVASKDALADPGVLDAYARFAAEARAR